MFLKDKNIILGVTGGIAAYKSASLASALVKEGANVHVLMTENAKNFINPITFETLTGNKCISDTFDRNFVFEVEHIALAKKADLVMIAPATANTMAKLAHGIADNMLTTTVLACTCPVLVSPAMNTAMYENPATQDNIATLRSHGVKIITPASGKLACGDTGAGKMPEPAELLDYITAEAAFKKDMKGLKILVTAGPTQEAIDPVRYISNHSSGKMGYALAKVCMMRGADVTLVSGPTGLTAPIFVNKIDTVSAADMYEAVMSKSGDADIIIKAAAVADFTPCSASGEKIKKSESNMRIDLDSTKDILAELGKNKRPGQVLCGFSMETKDLIENSKKKLEKKNLDMIVANSIKSEGAGFAGDTNIVTILTKDSEKSLPLMTKEEVAINVCDLVLSLMGK